MVQNLVKKLKIIKNSFDEFADYADKYPRNLQRWKDHRRWTTLPGIEKFQKELEKIHQYASAGRIVGTGTAVIGGLASVVGFCLSFSKDLKPIGKELMNIGSAAGGVGGVASAAVSLAEMGFNMKILDEVKAVLKKDEQLTKELLPFFKRSMELEEALMEVFGRSLKNDFEDILMILREIYPLYKAGGETWNRIQSYLSSQVRGNFELSDLQNLDTKALEIFLENTSYKVKEILLEFCHSDSVRKAAWDIYESVQKNPFAIDLSKLCFCITRKVAKKQCLLQSSLLGCEVAVNTGLLQGIFKTVTFALSVVAFISAVKDVQNGRSKYFDIIEKVKICLKEEVTTLENY